MAKPDFWSNQKNAAGISQEVSDIKETIEEWDEINNEASSLGEMIELAENDENLAKELEEKLVSLERKIGKEEKLLFLSGEYDRRNALLTIYAGAGGTESQDWVEMLLRMYLRYAEKKGFRAKTLAVTAGQEAGLKNATLEIKGKLAYGLLKRENGVHRLVRISPFSSQGLRHTSFAYVEIMPELDDMGEIEIDSKDLRVDTYRASGPGGQYVNKTESAVRVTHIPTGLAASSQSERSQGSNREQAMKMLASRLQHLMEREHKEKIEDLKGEATPIEWGRQIRSYVLHPYKMVKDHRTNYETPRAEAVLDGDLDEFIESALQLKDK
jgi:peptide chain release factor 2